MLLMISGCSVRADEASNTNPVDRTSDVEPTATYDWMAGESPVPNIRIGRQRFGLNRISHAISPSGVYFIEGDPSVGDTYIAYFDHGSDTVVKLCGRVDCLHDNPDCNAYLEHGLAITYYGGYVYAVEGGLPFEGENCKLFRMKPDGSDRVTLLDLNAFAKENGAEYADTVEFMEDYCYFCTQKWVVVDESNTSAGLVTELAGSYWFKLDGSMEAPEKPEVSALYYVGDMAYTVGPAQNGGNNNGIYSVDYTTKTSAFVIDHPGVSGAYMKTEAYYHSDGKLIRLDYGTMEEQILAVTGLSGNYLLCPLPDCFLLLAKNGSDKNVYIYNWNFQLVDTVKLNYSYEGRTQFMLVAETAEQIIFTDDAALGDAKYYINKAELGTGNVQIHEFKYA